jgi:hypothetical protein
MSSGGGGCSCSATPTFILYIERTLIGDNTVTFILYVAH